jgi:hypothetical protein
MPSASSAAPARRPQRRLTRCLASAEKASCGSPNCPPSLSRAKAHCQHCPLRTARQAGVLERAEPCGVWGGEIFHHRAIIARKRPRGRSARTRPDAGKGHCGRPNGPERRSCIHSSFSSWLLSTSRTSSRRRMTRGARVRPAALGHEHPGQERGSACPARRPDSNAGQQPSQPPSQPPAAPALGLTDLVEGRIQTPGTCQRRLNGKIVITARSCGNPVPVSGRGRARVFCGDACSRRFRNAARPAGGDAGAVSSGQAADPLGALEALIRQAGSVVTLARGQVAALDPGVVAAQLAEAEAAGRRAEARAVTAEARAAEAEQEMLAALEAAQAAHRGQEAAGAGARRAGEETAQARRELAEEAALARADAKAALARAGRLPAEAAGIAETARAERDQAGRTRGWRSTATPRTAAARPAPPTGTPAAAPTSTTGSARLTRSSRFSRICRSTSRTRIALMMQSVALARGLLQ